MGKGYLFCCKKCGFKEEFLLGVGMRFPYYCEELLLKAKQGQLGADLQRITNDDSLSNEYRISGENMLYKCPTCKRVKCEPRYDVARFIGEYSIDEDSIIYRHKHICKKCKGEMQQLDLKNLEDVNGICPSCGEEMKIDIEWACRWD